MVDGPNRYAYVRNNPIGGRDPTGLGAEDEEDGTKVQTPARLLESGGAKVEVRSRVGEDPVQKGDVVLVLTGGVEGTGQRADETWRKDDPSTGFYAQFVNELREDAARPDVPLHVAGIEPGLGETSTLVSAIQFTLRHKSEEGKLVIYGYSRGGAAAMGLAEALGEREPSVGVDLLVTVDAALGPLSGLAVDRTVPSNVGVNINYYTTPTGPLAGLESRGGPNVPVDPASTTLINVALPDQSHRMIQGVTDYWVQSSIQSVLRDDHATFMKRLNTDLDLVRPSRF